MLLTWSDRGIDGPAPSHHGPRAASDRGPVLRLLEHTDKRHRYQRALVLTVPAGARRAEELAEAMRAHVPQVSVRELLLDDPSDYGALFTRLSPLISELGDLGEPAARADDAAAPGGEPALDVLLSAGTPQAQTLWVLFVKAELIRARLLQVIPPAFVPKPHPRAVREVRLDIEGFPQVRALRAEVTRLRAERQSQRSPIAAQSEAMRALLKRLPRVAASELPVLILGETGAGKELVARALHEASARAAGPFVAENCGALAESVLASELFGHEAAAFTGAHKAHRGLFEQAHGGTIFLDEVGELSPQVQVMLLRVLQERTLRRVGGERSIAVDVRVLAATHRDLAQRVRDGHFREDLYYRLSGVALHVPPLRERTADLPAMIRTFLAEAQSGSGRRPPSVDAEVLRVLARYPWPGNVRQLRSEVARWTVFCDDEVTVADLSPELLGEAWTPLPARPAVAAQPSQPALEPLAAVLERAERAAIEAAYQRLSGNLSRCAQTLGIGRNTLKRKLRAWGHLPARAKTARPRRSTP